MARTFLCLRWFGALLWVAAIAIGSPTQAQDADATAVRQRVAEINRITLELAELRQLPLTATTRAMAMVNIALWDGWAISTRSGQPLIVRLDSPAAASPLVVAGTAAVTVLVDVFPLDAERIATSLQTGAQPSDAASVRLGERVGQAVNRARQRDGSNAQGSYRDVSGYRSVNVAGHIKDAARWDALLIEDTPGEYRVQRHVTPHWGQVKPFVIEAGNRFRPAAPPDANSAAYRAAMTSVIEASAALDLRAKTNCELWSGAEGRALATLWMQNADSVADRAKSDPQTTLLAHAAVAIALADASIATWDAKRAYDTARPITAIRERMRGQSIRAWGGQFKGTQSLDGGAFMPYQPRVALSPASSEYVSESAALSYAAASALTRFEPKPQAGVVNTYEFVAPETVEPGLSKQPTSVTFRNALDMARAAADSGLHCGTQFGFSIDAGKTLGERVGAVVAERIATARNSAPATAK